MVGTRYGAQACAGCRHARIRHLNYGRGVCVDVNYEPASVDAGVAGYRPTRCTCRGFAEAPTLGSD